MKIVVDINHPAHVHKFRNLMDLMIKKGYEILVIASDKDITYDLLDLYGLDYIKIGSYGKSLTNKIARATDGAVMRCLLINFKI